MIFKETLFFIGKCLTIASDNKNINEVEKRLKSMPPDWDIFVKVSTAHFVLPALYCNLKNTNLLKYLPKDLVKYMRYITHINRERNKQIISQAKDINYKLKENNITPIFLKGTGNLLAGIYDDIAERMVGDIDFLISKDDYAKTINLLYEFGYYDAENYEYYFPEIKHYRRLKKNDSIAAVEIHHELLIEKFNNEFNYSFISKDIQLINNITVLSYSNKLNLSIIADQINDDGFYYKTINLRNAYDVFILSKKISAKNAVNKLDKLSHPLNCFLAACFTVFNNVDCLEYNNTKKTASYLNVFKNQFVNIKKTKRRHKIIKNYLFIKFRLYIIYKSLISKEYRFWLFKRITDKNWLKEKLNLVRTK
jgi:hypothetical protein